MIIFLQIKKCIYIFVGFFMHFEMTKSAIWHCDSYECNQEQRKKMSHLQELINKWLKIIVLLYVNKLNEISRIKLNCIYWTIKYTHQQSHKQILFIHDLLKNLHVLQHAWHIIQNVFVISIKNIIHIRFIRVVFLEQTWPGICQSFIVFS